MKECFSVVAKDKNLVILLLAALLSGGYASAGAFLSYYTKYNCIGILPMEQLNLFIDNLLNLAPGTSALGELSILTPLLSVGSGIAYMLSMAIVPTCLKRMSKKQLWISTSILGLVSNIVLYVAGMFIPGLQYNTLGGMIFHIVLRFFSQFPAGMTVVLSITMLADHVDQKEMETGMRLEGTIYSIKSLFTKIAVAFFMALPLILLQIAKYDGGAMDIAAKLTNGPLIASPLVESIRTIVDPATGVSYTINFTRVLNTIFIGMTLVFAVVSILMIIPMLFYKVDEDKLQEEVTEYRKNKKAEEIARIENIYAETQK